MNKLHNVEDSQHLKDLLLRKKEAGKIDEDTYNQILASLDSSHPSESQKAFNYVKEVLMGDIKVKEESILNNENTSSKSNIRRTKAKSNTSFTKYPKNLAIPTMIQYQYATSLFEKGYAYLCPNYDTSNLKFKDGKLFFDGSEPLRMITEAELQNFKTKENITKIDGLPVLQAYYSILLASYEEAIKRKEKLPETLALYVPDLAHYLGLGRNINDKTLNSLMSQFHSFDNVISVMKSVSSSGKIRKSYFPVLSFLGYDAETNTIHVASLYLLKVIERIYKTSIKLNNKTKEPLLSKEGEFIRLPSHSYLIRPEITRERNQLAILNVFNIIATIERSGKDNIPHIKASTLIERNPQFQERLEKSKNPSQLLKRVFEKTWELLRDKTHLMEVYDNFQIPNDIPTMKTLDMVFEFPHNSDNGKKQNQKKINKSNKAIEEDKS